MNALNWITLRELLAIRHEVSRANGIQRGILNAGGVYSAVRRPFTSYAGEALFPSLLEKVAALIHSLIAFHPFKDGNVPTALVAADVCLRLNGRRLAPSVAVEPFFWSIARGERDVPAIATWLEANVEAWDEETP